MDMRFLPGCLLLVLLASGGCSNVIGPQVKGQILLDGKPLAGANVEFTGGPGGSHAITDDDGKFYLDGTVYKTVKPGKYLVQVTKYVHRKTGKAAADPEELGQWQAQDQVKNIVPAKYGPADNPLSADIKEGMNELPPFQLKSK
jgi:hypothetical protein